MEKQPEFKSAKTVVESLEEQLARLKNGPKISPEREAQMEIEAQDRVRRSKAAAVEAVRAQWNAPKRHAECTPSFTGEWNQKFESVKAMMDRSKGVLAALVGGRGNGKTQLAVELMRWKSEQGRMVRFTTAVEFFMAVKSTYKQNCVIDEREVMSEYRKPKLLVIDEIGKRGQSDWENTLLFELLNSRYNDMLDSILIDNRGKSEFIEMIGPSLASRMNEGGGIIECNWPSFRR